MTNTDMLDIIKSKQGKWGIALAVLSILSLVAGLTGGVDLKSGLISFVALLIVAAVLFFLGKRSLDNPAPADAGVDAGGKASSKFKPTKKVAGYIAVDGTNKQWKALKGKSKAVYAFSDLLDYELIEDGNTVTSGSLGRAVAGGLAFGGLGAVIGGMTGKQKQTCTKLQIRITVKDLKNPAIFFDLLSYEVKKDSEEYRRCMDTAQEIISLLYVIKSESE